MHELHFKNVYTGNVTYNYSVLTALPLNLLYCVCVCVSVCMRADSLCSSDQKPRHHGEPQFDWWQPHLRHQLPCENLKWLPVSTETTDVPPHQGDEWKFSLFFFHERWGKRERKRGRSQIFLGYILRWTGSPVPSVRGDLFCGYLLCQ